MSEPAYPQVAFAHQVHNWGANVLAIRSGTKKPAHSWKRYQTIRQTSADVDILPWGVADRIGIINGVGGIRSFDIDAATSYEPVMSVLSALGLPADYHWVEQSESGAGWHVWVVCDDEIPAGVLTEKDKESGVFWGESVDQSFDHLELRWENNQTVIASSGGVSRWLNGPPAAMPARVSVGAILDTFLRTTKRAMIGSPIQPSPSAPADAAQAAQRAPATATATATGDHRDRESVRAQFDMVAFAQMRFGGETRRDPDGQVRVLGNGGLLFDVKRNVWYRFNGEVGGDCFDLAGLAIYGEQWRRSDKVMFRAAFKEAAAYAGVTTEAVRVHRERLHVPPPPDGAQTESETNTPRATASTERRYRLYTATEMKERPMVTFRVEGLIPEGALCALVGNPGTYKTFVALDLALCIATGTPWHGRDVVQGRVVFISAEGAYGFGQRIAAWERKHWTKVDDEHFRVITDAPQLLDGADLHTLIASISEAMENPDGIFVDTLARTFDGEENSSQDMGAYIRALDHVRQTFSCFVCPIHHSNATGLRARGSSAFLAALDTEITLVREGSDVSLSVTKAKEFSEGEPMFFGTEVVTLGKHVTSLVLELKVPTVPNGLVPSEVELRVLGILTEVFGREGTTSSGWEKACEEAHIGHTQFNRAKTSLLNRGLVKGPTAGEYVRGFRYTPTSVEGTKVPRRYQKDLVPSNPLNSEGTNASPGNPKGFPGGGCDLVPSSDRGATEGTNGGFAPDGAPPLVPSVAEEEENDDDLF